MEYFTISRLVWSEDGRTNESRKVLLYDKRDPPFTSVLFTFDYTFEEARNADYLLGYYFVFESSAVGANTLVNAIKFVSRETDQFFNQIFRFASNQQYLNKVILVQSEVIEAKYFRFSILNGGRYILIEGELKNSKFRFVPLCGILYPTRNDMEIDKAVFYNPQRSMGISYSNPDPAHLFAFKLTLWLKNMMNDLRKIDSALYNVLI